MPWRWPQYLQMVLGLSPLTAGLWATPGTAASVLGALIAASAAARWGDRKVLAVTMAATAAGALLLVGLGAGGHAWLFATGFTVIGLASGAGLFAGASCGRPSPSTMASSLATISSIGFTGPTRQRRITPTSMSIRGNCEREISSAVRYQSENI